MESIDALAKAVNEFEGGLVLVSHDMRLISQVAKEIWICDHKTITMYQGDINNFKMDMRAQLNLEDDNKKAGKMKLKGDASVVKKADEKQKKMRGDASVAMTMEDNAKLSNDEAASSNIALDSILAPKPRVAEINRDAFDIDDVRQSLASINDNKLNEAPKSTEITSDNVPPVRKAYVPPHLRNKV